MSTIPDAETMCRLNLGTLDPQCRSSLSCTDQGFDVPTFEASGVPQLPGPSYVFLLLPVGSCLHTGMDVALDRGSDRGKT